MSKRSKTASLVAGIGLAALVAGSAIAQDADQAEDRAPAGAAAAQAGSAAAPVNASAPNARVAGLIDSGGRIVRRKGIRDVDHPDDGEYCILPVEGINVRTIVAIVSVEFFNSEFNEALVQWQSARNNDCPDNRITVYTLGDPNEDGDYVRTDGIAFSIYVP